MNIIHKHILIQNLTEIEDYFNRNVVYCLINVTILEFVSKHVHLKSDINTLTFCSKLF